MLYKLAGANAALEKLGLTFTKSAEEPLKDPKGGLTAAGRRHYERSGESKNLKPGVKKPVSEMSSEDMKRKGSWARRFYGRSSLPPLKKPNGEPTRLALTARAWGEPVPNTVGDAKRIAAKGTRLLEKAQKKTADLSTTIGYTPQQVDAHVDITKHLADSEGLASPSKLEDLSKYYKGFEESATAQKGQAALSQAAAKRAVPPPVPAAAMSKRTPTIAPRPASAVLSHAAQTLGPAKVIAGGVSHGVPVAGSASVLDELMRTGGQALGFVGKHAQQNSLGLTSLQVKHAMQLQFDSPQQQAQFSKRKSNVLGVTGTGASLAGGVAGGTVGGALGAAVGGPVGMVAGNLVGGEIGSQGAKKLMNWGVGTGMDAIHDTQQRANSTHQSALARMRSASNLPSETLG